MEASKTQTTRSTPTTKDTAKLTSANELPEYEEALEQGYIGVAVDTRDNDEYTVEGSIARAEEGPPDIRVEVDPQHAKQEPAL
jgi:hypothetical protein